MAERAELRAFFNGKKWNVPRSIETFRARTAREAGFVVRADPEQSSSGRRSGRLIERIFMAQTLVWFGLGEEPTRSTQSARYSESGGEKGFTRIAFHSRQQ